jgi:phenylpyruvate tautomerase PptA (4-oxalocrotonate tautomerase family)
MPYLRVHSVDMPREVKRTLATELTQTVVEARHLRGVERDTCTIRFDAFSPEDVSIGGKLISNGRLPDYQIVYRDHDLSRRDKQKLARRITETMARVLDLHGGDVMRVSVLFVEYDARDLSIGGTSLHDMWKRGVGTLFARVSRVVRRRKRAAAGTATPLPSARSLSSPGL